MLFLNNTFASVIFYSACLQVVIVLLLFNVKTYNHLINVGAKQFVYSVKKFKHVTIDSVSPT